MNIFKHLGIEDYAPDNIEVPETVAPAPIASAVEGQAVAEAATPEETQAQEVATAASAARAAVVEAGSVEPGGNAEGEQNDVSVLEEASGGEAPAGSGTEEGQEETQIEEEAGGAEGDILGEEASGEQGEIGDQGEIGATGSEGEAGLDNLGGEEASSEEEVVDEPIVEETGTVAEEPAAVEETAIEEPAEVEGGESGPEEEAQVEEDEFDIDAGPAETEGDETATEETEGSETSSEEAEVEEAAGEETDSSAVEETSSEEEETAEEEETSEEEEESEDEESDEDDDEDGIEVDIPDVDPEVTEEDVIEKEDEAEEAAEEAEEIEEEMIDTSKSIEELDKETVSAEAYASVLAHGIRTKDFNPQTVALAQTKLQHLSKLLGSEAPVIPSMEDYGVSNLEEYYTNSLESFSGFINKLRHVRNKFMDDFANDMNEKMNIKAVEKRLDSINTKCDKVIKFISELESGSYTVTVPRILRSKGGAVKQVTETLKWLGGVSGVFALDRKFLEGMSNAFLAAVKEGDSSKAQIEVNKILKLALPSAQYPAEAKNASPIGGYKFIFSDLKKSGSIATDSKNLGERAIPMLEDNSEYDNGDKMVAFTKSQLATMLKQVKILIGLGRGTSASAGKGIVASLDQLNRAKSTRGESAKRTDAGAKEADKALNNLVDQYWTALSLSLDNYEIFQTHLCDVADAVLVLVDRADVEPDSTGTKDLAAQRAAKK